MLPVRYRFVAPAGAIATTVAAVFAANLAPVQHFVTSVPPLLRRLDPAPLPTAELLPVLATATAIVALSLLPLFKPRPRRLLDVAMLAQKRVLLASFALATVGYYDYTYRVPRPTLILTTGALFVALPVWFMALRREPTDGGATVLVGDDRDRLREALAALDEPPRGYVAPPEVAPAGTTDGGAIAATTEELAGLPYLGTTGRLESVLVEHRVDTAVLAFADTDRAAFFGALATCRGNGVRTLVHGDHADAVLTGPTQRPPLVEVELEPWDVQDHVLKRLFDVVFAGAALLLAAPVAALVALGVALDLGRPVLYAQERTSLFGGTFTVHKFRTMRDDDETVALDDAADMDRVTRFGRWLRTTHLDELPQLWAILRGDMSVVGPRAVWTDEEGLLDDTTDDWRKRWFVKPGLTGLAQVDGATSAEPERKLRLDLEYIQRQSFWFDVKIVIRQLWQVSWDLLAVLRGSRDR